MKVGERGKKKGKEGHLNGILISRHKRGYDEIGKRYGLN